MTADTFSGADEEENQRPRRGPPRKQVLAVCCTECDSLDVTRNKSKGAIAYWSCNRCHWTWKEIATVGRNSAKLA